MCGPETGPVADSGDLIAIIHPNFPQSAFRGRLRLSNRAPGATTSRLQYEGTDRGWASGRLEVRIHKYGQLLDPSLESGLEDENLSNPIFHSFSIDPITSSTAGVRLNLGVGGDGIVGRAVSILDGSRRILGEGVIGWI